MTDILTNRLVLRTRPPVGEEGEEVARAHVAVVVEVGGAAFAKTPTGEQRKQVGCANIAVTIKIPRALALVRDAVAVVIITVAAGDVVAVRDAVAIAVCKQRVIHRSSIQRTELPVDHVLLQDRHRLVQLRIRGRRAGKGLISSGDTYPIKYKSV